MATATAIRICTSIVTDPRLLSLLHFGDSAFPAGGYAHSFGLETYCQSGQVRTREELERFLVAQLEGQAGPCDATAAVGVQRAATSGDPEAAATAYLYSATALLVGAALRLLPMGQLEGQRVLWALHPVIERVAREAATRDLDDLWSFAPGIELAGIRHASLDMRLFRS